MNWFDELLKIGLGVGVSTIIGLVVWIWKWIDKTDLRLHDYDRDLAHQKRIYLGLSQIVAKLDTDKDQIIVSFRGSLGSVSGRVQRLETRVYVVENRLSDSITHGFTRASENQFTEVSPKQ